MRLGSAAAASWLYKAQFLEAAAAVLILPIHLIIFRADDPSLRPWSVKSRTCIVINSYLDLCLLIYKHYTYLVFGGLGKRYGFFA